MRPRQANWDDGRMSANSLGEFHPRAWLEEGDGLLSSAKLIRDAWAVRLQTFASVDPVDRDWDGLTGLPRASFLLLSYAVEMFLKAGVAKAYAGCSEAMFSRDIKQRFGHKLTNLATEVAFPLSAEDRKLLSMLTKMVLVDARYPVTPVDSERFADTTNRRNFAIWADENFSASVSVATRIREHCAALDCDERNPATIRSWDLETDGFIVARMGGGLPPRVTFRLDSPTPVDGTFALSQAEAIFRAMKGNMMAHLWDVAVILEDTPEKTISHVQRTA